MEITKTNLWSEVSSTSFIIVLMMLVITSCSDMLDEHLYDSVPVDDFYKTEEEANLALNSVYNTLWGDIYRDGQWVTLSDVTGGTLLGGGDPNGSGDRSGNNTPWNSFSWTSDAREVGAAWEQNYDGVNEANSLIDKLAESNISSDVKAKIEGQAKFLRGLLYFNLVRLFGGVPLEVNGTFNLEDLNKPRSSAEEIYNQIITDLQEADQLLSPYSASDKSAGKATSAAAKALLAKVYLQQHDWSNAAAKANEVINMGEFELYDDYNDILLPENSNGQEMIFSIQHGGTSNEDASIFWTRMIYLFGPPAHTLSDGTSIRFHNLQDVVIFQVPGSFFDATPDTYRKWESMRNQMPYYFAGNTLVRDTVDLYAPFVVKHHYVDLSSAGLRGGVDFPLIRYPDVLLTYAEAVNEANGGPTKAAYDAINEVRQRARAVGTSNEQPESVYPDLSGLNQAQFRDSVLVERAREFIGEGHRRWDLLRHNRLINDAQQRGNGNAAEHHVLFPLPGNALSVNEELEQNPGY